MNSRGGWKLLAALAFLTTIVWSCAEVAPPPGGEVDKTGPTLLMSTPTNGSVLVDTSLTEIVLELSEPFILPKDRESVVISPRPIEPPKVKVSGKRLIIRLNESLKSRQTYFVSLTTDITDYRRNRLKESLTLAFTTDSVIAQGSISGVVYDDEYAPLGGMLVGLYAKSVLTDSTALDSVYPTYLSSTATDGSFSFSYLPDGEFFLVGFTDSNRDGFFNPVGEMFALPDREIAVTDQQALDSLYLWTNHIDTTLPTVISTGFNSNGLFRLRLSRAISTDLLRVSPSNLLLKLVSDTNRVYPAKAIAEVEVDETASLTVVTDSLPDGWYALSLAYAVDQPSITQDSIQYQYKPDVTPPAIEEVHPDSGVHLPLDTDIRLRFSEPLDRNQISDGAFILLQDTVTPVPLNPVWRNELTLSLNAEGLAPGHRFRLLVSQPDVVDRFGNAAGDSLSKFEFSILSADSLGSISGSIEVPQSAIGTPVGIRYVNTASDQVFVDTTGTLSFHTELPPGKYLLSAFLDDNLDGRRSSGTISPYRLSERVVFLSDTLTVRARFETAGTLVNFK